MFMRPDRYLKLKLEPQNGSSHELLKEFVENYDRVKEEYGDSF